MNARHRAESRSRRRAWPWLLGGVGALALVTAGLFAWDGFHAVRAAEDLKAGATAAKEAIAQRDAAALAEDVVLVQDAALSFAQATDGPHWWLASHVPWVSRQAVPLMQVGDSVERIAADALGPLAEMGDLSALAAPEIVDGRIDPDVLEPFRPALAQAAVTLNAQVEALEEVSLDGTLDQVKAPFVELEEQLAEVRDLIQGAHVAAEVLPTMLGGEGARTYLVMIQNNAEPRATGGIPGAVIEVTVDDGRISLGGYTAGGSLTDKGGVGGLTEDEERIFTRRMEVYPQDVNFTPEYPRSAIMLTRFWENAGNDAVDGVLSLDPVALGDMLEGAPAKEIGPFTISGDNLASVMLHESYVAFPEPKDQDQFFARAASELFGTLVTGGANTLGGLETAIEEGRFLAWSANTAEQELIASTPVGGVMLERGDALGIFVNAGSATKIGWYVESEVSLTDHLCTDGTLAGQTLDVTLTHTYDGAVEDLPRYVGRMGDVPDGEFHANLLLFPADGTGVGAFRRDGEASTLNGEHLDGRSMASARIVLAPGQTTTVTFELEAAASGLLPPSVVMTPGAHPTPVNRSADAANGC